MGLTTQLNNLTNGPCHCHMICNPVIVEKKDMAAPDCRTPDSFEAIFENARKLRPWLAGKSEEIEIARQLPADVVDLRKAAGVFRMNMPRSWNGPELTSMQQVEIIEELSRGDASVGWCVMIGCTRVVPTA